MRYPGADWRPISGNFRRGGNTPKFMIIHIMQGTLAGSDSWFRNPAAQVSAHFGVGKDGMEAFELFVFEMTSAGLTVRRKRGRKSGAKVWTFQSLANGVAPGGQMKLL